jgi:hypothetical protein
MEIRAARNANEAMVGSGGVCVWRESGVRRWFCVDAFGRNMASVVMTTFSYLIYFSKKCYKFWTLNATCKYNAAILQFNTKRYILVNFDRLRHSTQVFKQRPFLSYPHQLPIESVGAGTWNITLAPKVRRLKKAKKRCYKSYWIRRR